MYDLVAWCPERFDKYPDVPPKLLVEDEFEAGFFHEAANNLITRQNYNLGESNTILNNARQIHKKSKPMKSKPSGWTDRSDFITPCIRLCTNKQCYSGKKHWDTNITNLIRTIKSKNEFTDLINETTEFIDFKIGNPQRVEFVCPAGKHIQ